MLKLVKIKKTNPLLQQNMAIHYSQPKGFVGRNICYNIFWDDICYGNIVGGSATLHLPGRNEYFNIGPNKLNNIVNNIFFHIEKQNNTYPCRWFSAQVLKLFRHTITQDWYDKYGDKVIGFESLVELPRTGQCYKKDGWDLVGQTKGFTCKRVGGLPQTEKWGGVRVWDYNNLRPKLVFCKKTVDLY